MDWRASNSKVPERISALRSVQQVGPEETALDLHGRKYDKSGVLVGSPETGGFSVFYADLNKKEGKVLKERKKRRRGKRKEEENWRV